MAQSSVKSFFPTRKRPAVEELKSVSNSPKALLLDESVSSSATKEDTVLHHTKIVHVTPVQSGVTEKKLVRPHHGQRSGSATKARVRKKLNYPEGSTLESFFKAPKEPPKAEVEESSTPERNVSFLLKDKAEQEDVSTPAASETSADEPPPSERPSTPVRAPLAEEATLTEPHCERPSTPENSSSAEEAIFSDLGLNDLKVKINRSKRRTALKDSLHRYHSRDARLKEIASRLQATTCTPISKPSVEEFSTFEIEVPVSPLKSPLRPQRLFLSPTKSPRKGLMTPSRLDFSSPAKSEVYVSPRKLLEERPSPVKAIPCHLKFELLANGDALILPFKYRSLFEIFCSVDTVSSMFHNRNEKITFTKLKSGVQEMLRRNFTESHLAQIKTVVPNAFEFSQEKYQVFGKKSEAEYHLIIKPLFNDGKSDQNVTHFLMTPSVLAARKREFNKSLLEITKLHHKKFLLSLDPPLDIPMDKLTRWHPEFEIDLIPDIALAELPPSPAQIKKPSAKDVLENAKSLLSANARVSAAIESLTKRLEGQPVDEAPESPSKPFPSFSVPCHTPGSTNDAMAAASKALKGVPQSFLNKIKAKQAARAVEAMTRSPAQNKKAVMLSRLPEIARIVRNLFVIERKSVLPLDEVTTKVQHSCRENLTTSEVKSHLSLIQENVPEWMLLCLVRNVDYVKLLRSANVEAVMLKLEKLVEKEDRIYHCR